LALEVASVVFPTPPVPQKISNWKYLSFIKEFH
jgi:hypothetical protein